MNAERKECNFASPIRWCGKIIFRKHGITTMAKKVFRYACVCHFGLRLLIMMSEVRNFIAHAVSCMLDTTCASGRGGGCYGVLGDPDHFLSER